jgi:hypothetical protein
MLAQHAIRLPKQMLQCVVVCYDKEFRAPFMMVTPPMLDGFANGQSF